MKNISILLTLLIPLLTFSQTKEELEKGGFFKNNKNLFRAYVVAGANFTQIDGDNSAGYNNIGANGGVGVFVTYSNKFTNSLEITYSMKGAKRSLIKPQNTQGTFNYQMDYIDIPLLFNYHDFKIAIFQAGFSYSQLLRTKFLRNNAEIDVNHYNWNIDIVAGITFLIKDKWGLNFKYNYSLLNNLDNGGARGGLLGLQSAKNSNKSIIGRGSNWYHHVLTFRLMYVIN